MDRCKSCGADIIWGKTRNNASIPLSVASKQKRFINVGNDRVEMVDTWVSHFSDCPNAQDFRRNK